ncbi:hypothetical protein [Methylobacterium radiotolerans]|uniref:hypothetical protein n=1 Tax=Methylobacterium radiotolerans TaxID=31998 RepID=UPI0011155C70|nr:hypothetical protein [Methylobacterium radiotolerans]
MAEETEIRAMISALFDEVWYIHAYPDVAAAGVDPVAHYLSYGADEGRDPHPLFDTSWYLSHSPEVIQTGLNPLAHYILVGAASGKDPHPLFATSWYLRHNPQISETRLNPLLHYISGTAPWHASPHPLFDSAWYLSNNPDVAAAGINPLVHYIADGAREGRSPSPLFDPIWYMRQCPDGWPVGMTALEHYLTTGGARGLDPHPLFDTTWYVRQLTQDRPANITPLEHYLRFGCRDASSPHPLFDSHWYLEKYPEVSASKANPLAHYLSEGSDYGAEPHPLFRGNWYLSKYAQNIAPGVNPLMHYVLSGAKNHLDPSPEFSGRFYTNRYRDVDWESTNPLVHYITLGRAQGRSPAPLSVLYRQVRRVDDATLSSTSFEAQRHISVMSIKPKFLILMSEEDRDANSAAAESLTAQIYKNFAVLSAPDVQSVVESCSDDPDLYLIWLEAGDVLKPAALYHFASAINRAPGLGLIYGDEEIRAAPGAIIPFYKPAWSPDYLEGFNYIGRAVCYKITLAAECLRSAENPFDLLLRVSEKGTHIGHVREMIATCPDRRYGTEAEVRADLACLNRRCARLGRDAEFVAPARPARLYRSHFPKALTTKISIILYGIGDNLAAAADLRYGVSPRIMARPSVEFGFPESITVEVISLAGSLQDRAAFDLGACSSDPSSRDPDTGRLATALNRAVETATGHYILFLRKAPEPPGAICLANMVQHIVKPHVGAVGAKLLAADGRTAQFGLLLFDGMSHRVHHGSMQAGEDYFFSHSASRNFQAIELDSLMTERNLFQSVGGFDAAVGQDQIAVDYCLKIQVLKKMVVCDPDTRIESATAVDEYGSELSAGVFNLDDVFVERWSSKLTSDPFYNLAHLSIGPAAYDGRSQAD